MPEQITFTFAQTSVSSNTCVCAPQIVRIPDVGGAGASCFSDGVGIITRAGMERAMQQYPAYRRGTMPLPSALQVRLGGAKGMLTLWDDRSATVAVLVTFPSTVQAACVLFATILQIFAAISKIGLRFT